MSYLLKRTIIAIDDEVVEECRSTVEHLQDIEQELDAMEWDDKDPLGDLYQTLISARTNMEEFLDEYDRYVKGKD